MFTRRSTKGAGRNNFDRPAATVDHWRHYCFWHRKLIVLQHHLLHRKLQVSLMFQTADEYLTEYNSRRGNEYSRFHGYVRATLSMLFWTFSLNEISFFLQTYDGIWAAALAIQYVAKRKEQFLRHFEYRVKDWENIFLEALKNTSFEGVTVNTDFRPHFLFSALTYEPFSFRRVQFDFITMKDVPIFCWNSFNLIERLKSVNSIPLRISWCSKRANRCVGLDALRQRIKRCALSNAVKWI